MSRKEGILADENAQAQLRRRAKDDERQANEDIRWMLSSPAGRRFAYRLVYQDLELECGYLANDAGVYRFLGRQDAARRLKNKFMEVAPDLWELAVIEQLRESRQHLQTTRSIEREHEEKNLA
jgi:hypothetical protein